MAGTPYWQAVKAMRLGLPEVVHVTTARPSDDGRKAGVVSEAAGAAVAQMLVDGSLRLSTPEEIRAYEAEQDRRRVLAASRSDTAAGRFRFSEDAADVRCRAAA